MSIKKSDIIVSIIIVASVGLSYRNKTSQTKRSKPPTFLRTAYDLALILAGGSLGAFIALGYQKTMPYLNSAEAIFQLLRDKADDATPHLPFCYL
ncbi:MAG TPA: hypothetical protein VJZ75_03295 [Candidatus Bathyarchaeia archaeon]|nr:hypothetical protein [Candidatus Bathyarchaeia archaeon]